MYKDVPLSFELSTSITQHLLLTNKYKSALPIALLSYKLYQQQHDSKQYQLCLLLANNQQVQLTSEHSRNLIQDLAIQDSAELSQEIPLPLLTQEQVTVLLSYIPIINALNTTTQRQLKMLCDLIITASYLDIQNSGQTISFTGLVIHALGDKLLQSIQYQDQYSVTNALPDTLQYILAHYLIDNSVVCYTL